MFVYRFKAANSSSTKLTAVSTAVGTTDWWTETSEIDLNAKWHDGKDLSLYIDSPIQATKSTYLQCYMAIGPYSGVTYNFTAPSGTSILINNTSGASQGLAQYRKYSQVVNVIGDGVTKQLVAQPYVTLGHRLFNSTGSGASNLDFYASLIVA